MENCLKTQLKEDVNNDNLVLLGSFYIQVKHVDSELPNTRRIGITVKSGETVTFTSRKSGCYLSDTFAGLSDPTSRYDKDEPMSITDGGSVYVSDADFEILVTNKYNIIGIGYDYGFLNYTIDLENLKFSNDLGRVQLQGSAGDVIECLSGKPLNSLRLGTNNELVCDIEQLSFPLLTRLTLMRSDNVIGDIGALVTNTPSVVDLTLSYTNIGGSLASLIDNGSLALPGLKTLAVSNTPNLTKNQSDIDTLTSLGVTVSA